MNREMLPYWLQINYNTDLGLLNISPLCIQLPCGTRDIIRPAAGVLHSAHTLPRVLGIAIALFLVIYREFHTKDAHQFIRNMHIGTMFALTPAKGELCSPGGTAGFY